MIWKIRITKVKSKGVNTILWWRIKNLTHRLNVRVFGYHIIPLVALFFEGFIPYLSISCKAWSPDLHNDKYPFAQTVIKTVNSQKYQRVLSVALCLSAYLLTNAIGTDVNHPNCTKPNPSVIPSLSINLASSIVLPIATSITINHWPRHRVYLGKLSPEGKRPIKSPLKTIQWSPPRPNDNFVEESI